MTNRNLLAATALQTGALFVFASATPANAAAAAPVATTTPVTTVSAQDVPNTGTNSTLPETTIPATTNAQTGKGEAGITVTGSRIRRPNLESVVPVTSIQGEQFFQRGGADLGEALNDLPQLRSTFAQQNPGTGIGIAGLNLLDLRGLSPKRTLVLVNGRRHVGADILSSASVPDVNTISQDLIDRVDIVTGGNSAVYGSDAVAGVVNFILKRDFDGIQVRAQGSEAAAGFGTTYFGSVMFGKNFGGGRGNVTLQAEYNHDNRVFGSDIPWYRHVDAFAVVDVDPGTLPAGSDGVPDRVLVRDIRSATISTNGLVPITQQTGATATAPCGVGLGSTNGGPSTVGGTSFNCTFIFNPDGSLVAQTGSRMGTGPNPTIVGGNGQTTREGQQLSVFPENKRINLNLLAHYDVSDAFQPFVEAKWVRLDTTGNNAGPSFIQGAQFDFRERTRLDNPFLDPNARSLIAAQIIASGCNPSISVTCSTSNLPTAQDTATNAPQGGPGQGTGGRLSANDIAMINAGTYRFLDLRRLMDIGLRDETFRRDTWRVVAGARGTFNTDWSYEISANYGQMDQKTHTVGFIDRQRFMLAMDAGRDPADGKIKCRSQFDPTAKVQYGSPSSAAVAAAQAARLNADVAACVPYNPFGASDNSASIRYFTTDEHKSAQMKQLDLLGYVSGDSSQLLSLPGGPIGFVLGAEYRREQPRYTEDPFVDLAGGGLTNDVDVGNFNPKAFHVTEAFGELNVPILKDMPFFHELSLSGAGRYSRYAAPIKGVWTYNIGGEWAPVRDIRFRGNYGKAVRAPNLSETGFPVVPNFSNGFVDPCSATGLSQKPNRQQSCSAALGTLLPNVREAGTAGYSLGILSGSNPNLVPEVSHSLTVGVVVQPRFLPGFSASADYYNIKVTGVIAAVAAQTIVNNCYDLAPGNLFCNLFQRVPAGGVGQNGETPGNVVFNSIVQGPQNYAKRIRRGIDFNANYRARLSSNVVLDTGLIWVHGLQNSNFENVLDPKFENQLLGELGDPKDEGRLDMDLKVGHVTFGYQMHYIGWQYISAAEDQISLPTACVTTNGVTTCPPSNADFATPLKFPVTTYHGLRVQWDTGPAFGHLKNIQVYAGVDNLFDRHPPLGITGTGTGPVATIGNAGIYDVFGRRFYGGVKVRY